MNRPILFLTAVDVERRAVLEHLTDLRDVTVRGTRFIQGTTRRGRHTALLAQTGQGNAGASLTAQQAIARFTPAIVIFSGIAGALQPHLELGDVVVAEQITAFGGGLSEDDGFWARPRSWQVPHAEQQFARDLAEDAVWKETRPAYAGRVMVGHIASGEVVLNSRTSDIAQRLLQHHNDALAVEMEGAGVARAAHSNSVPFMVVRAISDRADGTKYTTDRGDAQRQAAATAAAFAVLLGDELARRRPDESRSGRPSHDQGDDMTQQPAQQNVQQTAQGNARVGNMVGFHHGKLIYGRDSDQAAAALNTELARLRRLLEGALAEGRISDAEHREASQHLADAESVVPPQDPQQQGAALWVLGKLLGIVGGVADLSDHVNRIITSVKGMTA
ncbi:5'-methylthioadenosine/S-adenosylhomocysteine nucleosidase [Kineosporia sp. J2-2]|uniref:5'-methylthioadenosine/S-adenosylhomocysteine nucleosidase n=1 Tax=Kineosporia corallincola TaxID=2835133 RepID=A0ABS5TPA8_9ACTN|nr:5'-methylthioadenosine/S-adenosylhomocysteine nucleosidase [Kineosporia corallincola]MBT0772926.1 5'-methylthioadenosine/S-adenosylhomocysteine nucleosidase [Kineosporia corallincola]